MEPTALFDPKRMTAVGWRIDKRTSFETWQAQGEMLQAIESATPFWLGDWCEFGDTKYGEKYAQAVKDTGHSQQTLINCAFVARHVPIERRRADLSFSHHAEIAGLEPEDQDAMMDWAIENRASVKGLREHVNEFKASHRTPTESVVAAPQTPSESGAVPEPTGDNSEPVGAPETEYTYCEKHGHVLVPHVCNGTGDAPAEPTVIDVTPQPEAPAPKAQVVVAALYEKTGKLTKSQAEKFCIQHEREMVEDLGGEEPEWLNGYIAWVYEAVQGIGPRHTAADAFAAGFTAGKGI